MTDETLPKGAIAVPYTPDDHLGKFGWIWTNAHRGDPPEWHLVSTHLPDGKDVEPVITFHEADGTHPLDEYAADIWGGAPYLPMVEPKGEPWAGLEVTVRLDAGASATMTFADRGQRTERMQRDVLALLTAKEPASLTGAYHALHLCLGVLYTTLRCDLECACVLDDGMPDLDSVDAEARPFIELQIRAIHAAETVAGRHLPDDAPGWLAEAIDGWICEGAAP